MSCIFCQIAEGAVPSTVVFKDDKVVAFRDIHPQAPVHIVIIPVEHFTNLTDTRGDDWVLLHIFLALPMIWLVQRELRIKAIE